MLVQLHSSQAAMLLSVVSQPSPAISSSTLIHSALAVAPCKLFHFYQKLLQVFELFKFILSGVTKVFSSITPEIFLHYYFRYTFLSLSLTLNILDIPIRDQTNKSYSKVKQSKIKEKQ